MILIRKEINTYPLQLILVCLIPISLVFSRFLADFFLVLVCFIFIFQSFIEKKNYFNNFFFKVFLIFWLIITFRSIFSEEAYFSLKSSLPYIRFGIFAIAVYYLFKKEKKYCYYFFLSFSLCLIPLVFDGYIQYFFKQNIFNYPITVYGENNNIRLSGFFKDELILGSFISRMLPFYIGLYYYCLYHNLTKDRDIVMFVFLLLSTILVLLSGERVAFFYISISFLLGILFLKLPIKKFVYKFTICFVIILSIVVLNSDVKNRLVETTFNQIGISKDKTEKTDRGEKYIFSIHHHNHIIASYKIFKENIFFGSGVKMFRFICDDRYKINPFACSTHPHNTVMLFLSETGIIGTMFYIICFFFVVKSFFTNFFICIKDKKNNLIKSKLFFLTALFISLMPLLPAGNFFNNWISIISFFPIGFYFITNFKLQTYEN